MRTCIIAYDLHRPGQEYDRLIDAIETHYPEHWHLQQSVWLISTDDPVLTIRDKLNPYLDSNDKVFVSIVCNPTAWVGYGSEAGDWISRHLF